MHLSIIIPVLNLWNLTEQCLKSIKKHTSGHFYEVIVVDNGSTDETVTQCSSLGRSLFEDRFRYVRVEKNINFGPACNLGAEKAGGRLLFFLNNDTLVTRNWFAPLLEVFKTSNNLTACSPMCLFPESKRVQSVGIAFDGGLGVRHPYFMFPGSHPVVMKERRLQALSAAALMIPAADFTGLGGFFPGFVNGFEDIDLCCRIRGKGGRLVQENRSVIYHLASRTPGRNKADRENIQLVNERCVGCFRPDFHRIVLNDGFKCELTPWLEMIVRDTDENKIFELGQLVEIEELSEAIEIHPLWEDGYDRLSALYEAAGNIQSSAETLFYGAFLFPTPGKLSRLESLSSEAGLNEFADFALNKLNSIRNNLSSLNAVSEQARRIHAWAMANRDNELVLLYEKWLKENSKP